MTTPRVTVTPASIAAGLRATGIMPSVLVTLPPYPVKFR